MVQKCPHFSFHLGRQGFPGPVLNPERRSLSLSLILEGDCNRQNRSVWKCFQQIIGDPNKPPNQPSSFSRINCILIISHSCLTSSLKSCLTSLNLSSKPHFKTPNTTTAFGKLSQGLCVLTAKKNPQC